jgi:hypothetical protein
MGGLRSLQERRHRHAEGFGEALKHGKGGRLPDSILKHRDVGSRDVCLLCQLCLCQTLRLPQLFDHLADPLLKVTHSYRWVNSSDGAVSSSGTATAPLYVAARTGVGRGPWRLSDRPRNPCPAAWGAPPDRGGPRCASTQPQPASLCAMVALPRAGKGPGEGTQMTLVDPSLITCVAIVVVVSWSWHSWPPLGRGCRETLPKDAPVPREAAYSPTPEADRPATPEWVVRGHSHDSVLICGAPASTAEWSGRTPSGTLGLALRVPLA